jgi:hypothetical protein
MFRSLPVWEVIVICCGLHFLQHEFEFHEVLTGFKWIGSKVTC